MEGDSGAWSLETWHRLLCVGGRLLDHNHLIQHDAFLCLQEIHEDLNNLNNYFYICTTANMWNALKNTRKITQKSNYLQKIITAAGESDQRSK